MTDITLSIEEIQNIAEEKRNSIENLLVSLWESSEDNGISVLNASYEYLQQSSRIAALEAQNKKLVEALATLEAISINAIEHVALANYPEREKKAIAQVEAYFSRARQAAQ